MDKIEIWANLKKYTRNNQQIISGFVALLAAAIIIFVLFSHTTVGVIDYGEYTQTLYDVGLSYTEEVLQEGNSQHFLPVIEKFKITGIQFLQVLQLEPAQSLIYPITVISIFCKLLQIDFSTRYLALLLSIITIGCIYSITKSAYVFLKEKAAAVGIACCIVFLCGNYIIYFNSLYRNGIYFVSFLAFFTILLHMAATGGKSSYKSMLLLLFTSLLLLNAKSTTIVYLPMVIAANISAMIYCRPHKEKRIAYFALMGILLIFVVRCNILYTLENEALFSDSQMYHSFFNGALQESEEPEKLLSELGMDTSLKEDIGKNVYLSDENYVLAPNSREAQEEIFSHLGYKELIQLYQRHPGIYVNVLETTAQNLKEIDTSRFLYTNRRADEGTEWVERFVWWQWIRNLIVPESLTGYLIVIGGGLLLFMFLFILCRKERENRSVLFLFLLICFFVIIQFTTLYAWQGYAERAVGTYYFILPYDIFLIFGFSILLKMYEKSVEKYREFFAVSIKGEDEEEECETAAFKVQEIPEAPEELFLKNPIGSVCLESALKGWKVFKDKILGYPGRAAFFFFIISFLIVFGVLFFPKRIGAYNNGDFGRMMSAMNIRYTEEDWANVGELSLTKVVEKYNWEENYDYSKIMPYNADLSQIWFSLPLKIIDNYVGLQFSTVYVTIMYAILIVISMYFIMQVLFRRFGTRCFWLAIALLLILLDQANLGWLNSLFGEGIAIVSLLMVMASAFKIADMERGSCRWSFFYLFFSEIIFIGAKAQFTVTTPILLIGTLALVIYHRPGKIWKCFPYYGLFLGFCVWLSASAVGIYTNNEDISSPDATYQSVFYGLLMLVDDPAETLEELGLDPAMAVDTGKHAFLDKSEYYCAPRTEAADEMLYSKISTFDVLGYYLKHPALLFEIMEDTAQAAAQDMPNFILVVGEKTTQPHEIVKRFDLWGTIRSYLVSSHFWELVFIYFLELILVIRFLVKRKNSSKDKLLVGMLFMISAVGIIQYPLTIIGNGFADNTKQLFIFRVTFDITVLMGIFLLFPYIRRFMDKLGYCYANKISLCKAFKRQKENGEMTGGLQDES